MTPPNSLALFILMYTILGAHNEVLSVIDGL